MSKPKVLILFLLLSWVLGNNAFAEENPEDLAVTNAGQAAATVSSGPPGVSKVELDANVSQLKSEVRSLRDLTELRVNILEKEIEQTASYVVNLLFAFMIAGGIVVFVVLVTLNKQTGVNNEKMRSLIREAGHSLNDLHRMLDRPEAEHFHVSRKLTRIMNKMRESEHVSLPQKDIGDIYAASEDPTLPVTLHLQANALKEEQAGNSRQAIILWERMLEIDSNNPEVLLHLAKNYKKLSETSSGEHVAEYRSVSLDYFQQYSIRTSQHLNTAHEVQQRMSDANTKLPNTLEKRHRSGHPIDKREIAPFRSHGNSKFQLRNTAGALLGSSASSANKAVMRHSVVVTNGNGASKAEEVKGQGAELEKAIIHQPVPATKIEKVDRPQAGIMVNEPVMKNGMGISAEKTVSNKLKDREPRIPSGEVNLIPAKATIHKKKNLASTKSSRVSVVVKRTSVAKPKTNGVSLPKSLSPVAEQQKTVSDAECKRAFASRMDKAKEYFVRFSGAKSKDQMKWLGAAEEELIIAEKFLQNDYLYRCWGSALLEMARITEVGKGDKVGQAIEIFKKGNGLAEGAFLNEMALCHAIVDQEASCRQALEQAQKLGTLNPEIYIEQPEFAVYKERPWYQELLHVSTG